MKTKRVSLVLGLVFLMAILSACTGSTETVSLLTGDASAIETITVYNGFTDTQQATLTAQDEQFANFVAAFEKVKAQKVEDPQTDEEKQYTDVQNFNPKFMIDIEYSDGTEENLFSSQDGEFVFYYLNNEQNGWVGGKSSKLATLVTDLFPANQ